MLKPTNNKGYVVLISVLVVSIVGLAIASSLIALGVGSTLTSLSTQQSHQAKALADTCAEHALNELLQDLVYAGNETLNVGLGSCEILAVQGSGNTDRIIQTTGTIDTIVRKVEVNIATVQPQTQLTSWQEVADF